MNFLLPAACLSCRRDLFSVPPRSAALCSSCSCKISWNMGVERCADSAIDGIAALADYEGPVRDLIHAFKYRGKESVGDYFADRWMGKRPVEMAEMDGVVAVPMSPWKEFKRGYNPAWILAREVARLANVPFLEGGLSRRWISRSQTGLRRKERLKNAGRSFFLTGRPNQFREKSILLVDDVCTTGATMEACAALLKRAGAKRVIGGAAARER